MNEDQARIIRIYQFLLSKDVTIKNTIENNRKKVNKKNLETDDALDLWYSLIKLEIWQEFAGEIWNLLK